MNGNVMVVFNKIVSIWLTGKVKAVISKEQFSYPNAESAAAEVVSLAMHPLFARFASRMRSSVVNG